MRQRFKHRLRPALDVSMFNVQISEFRVKNPSTYNTSITFLLHFEERIVKLNSMGLFFKFLKICLLERYIFGPRFNDGLLFYKEDIYLCLH